MMSISPRRFLGRSIVALVPTLLLATLLTACGSGKSAAGTVAIVAGKPVRESDLQSYVNYAQSYYSWAYTAGTQSPAACGAASTAAGCVRVRRQALRRLLEEGVVEEYAARHRIALSRSQQAAVKAQADVLLKGNTTAAQLVAEGKVARGFISGLLEKEALIQRVEGIVVSAGSLAGVEYHVRRFTFPFSSSSRANIYASALKLATNGGPAPLAATVKFEWIAPFRVPQPARSAVAAAAPGQYVGPFREPGSYLVMQVLQKARHRYGKPARQAMAARVFTRWIDEQLRHTPLRCFTASGATTACPTTA